MPIDLGRVQVRRPRPGRGHSPVAAAPAGCPAVLMLSWTWRSPQWRTRWTRLQPQGLAPPPLPPPPLTARPVIPPPPVLQKEIRDIERDKASGVTIEVQGNSLQKLIGRLNGAAGRGRVTANGVGCLFLVCGRARRSCGKRLPLLGLLQLLKRRFFCRRPAGPRDTPFDGGVFYVDIQVGAG